MTAGTKVVLVLGAAALLAAPHANAQTGGDAIYKKQCSMCHGPDGAGNTGMGKTFKLRDLRSADVQKQTDVQLSDIIAKGKGKMPAYQASLGAERIKAVVAYLRSIATK